MSHADEHTDDPFHIDVKVNCEPTEMGIRISILSPTFNMILEFDPREDPVMMQSILASVPQFVIHAVDRMISEDSPATAEDWWNDGLERVAGIRAERIQ